jgi:putative chitinase
MKQETINKLKGHIPDNVFQQISDTCNKFNITTELRLAHFLSQGAHESENFTIVKENLNYSEKGLLTTFKKYFTPELAKQYAHQPEKIANRVYANRMGNGDEKSGDGYKFCGRGYIQLTGKDNYIVFDKLVDDDILASPILVATKYPMMSAAFFFNNNNLWIICDKGATPAVVKQLTLRVNGGTLGLNSRQQLFDKFYKLLS